MASDLYYITSDQVGDTVAFKFTIIYDHFKDSVNSVVGGIHYRNILQ